MRRQPKVTRQMFIEEYTRQLIKFSGEFRDPMTLGRELAYVAQVLDGKIKPADATWWIWTHPGREACRVLGLNWRSENLTADVIRALPKE